MPSVLRLSIDAIGPSDRLRLRRLDQAIDFTRYAGHITVGLEVPRSPTSGSRNYIVHNVSVIDADELEIWIDLVGTRSTLEVPPGPYEVWARVGALWSGRGDRLLQVRRRSASLPVAAPAVLLSTALLRIRLFLLSIPSRVGSALTFAYARLARWILNTFGRPGVPGPVPVVPGGAPPAVSHVKPMADGEEVFAAVADTVRAAERFVFLTTWGFDQFVRMGSNGQVSSVDPRGVDLLKEQSLAMARSAEQGLTGPALAETRGDVRVLVWDASLDDDYAPDGNNLEDLSVSRVPWSSVENLSPDSIGPYLRQTGRSGESHELLSAVHRAYRRLDQPYTPMPYPSGVMCVTQNHPTKPVLGTHHQKFVLTEKGAYVGGLNFLKEYWDRTTHLPNEPGRSTSKGPGSGSGPAPLHDTGSIVSDAASQDRLRQVFAQRWDDAVQSKGCYEGLLLALGRLRSNAGRRDRAVYDHLIAFLRGLRRPLVGGSTMSIPLAPSPIPDADATDVKVTFTLPNGTAWATGNGVHETFDEYLATLDQTGDALSTVFIETQFFQDHRLATRLHERWRLRGARREIPYAHIVIPYMPDTHFIDVFTEFIRVSERERIIRAEFRNIRWLEIRTMRILLKQNAAGEWVPGWEVADPATQISIVGPAGTDPRELRPDSQVHIHQSLDLDSGQTVGQINRTAGEIMCQSDICGYTLAMMQPTPQGATARDRQRAFFRTNGIYVHSKAAIFINDPTGAPVGLPELYRATVGSSNLNPRSLKGEVGSGSNIDPGKEDSEANVWWSHSTKVKAYFQKLAKEHLAETDPQLEVSGQDLRERALAALNRIRVGQPPGQRLIRLDIADRLDDID